MRNISGFRDLHLPHGVCRALAIASIGLLLSACAQGASLSQMTKAPAAEKITTSAVPGTPAAAADTRSELQKATEYWGTAYSKNPNDAQAGLNYAKNLKALGEKRQALAILQSLAAVNADNRAVTGEYGRLALEFDQVSLAQTLLEKADDPANPDWRIVSARGTVLAKQGLYRDAIPYYEKALMLAPDKASILSNLALAHTMDGHPEKAEPLLKRAAEAGSKDARVNQNLALVLGLQGKYDEAKLAAVRTGAPDKATENVDYVREIVKLKAKPLSPEVANAEPKAAGEASVKQAEKAPAEPAKKAADPKVKAADAAKKKADPKIKTAEAPKKQDEPKGKTAEAPTKQPALKGKVVEDRKQGGWTTEVAAKP
jgi:Flp pilus assembly protein TadD